MSVAALEYGLKWGDLMPDTRLLYDGEGLVYDAVSFFFGYSDGYDLDGAVDGFVGHGMGLERDVDDFLGFEPCFFEEFAEFVDADVLVEAGDLVFEVATFEAK